MHYLNFRQNGHNRNSNAEDEVEADENFVLCAVVRFGVIHIEEHDSSKSQRIEDEGAGQKSCKK